MAVCTDELSNLDRTVLIDTNNLLMIENGVIKTGSGKIVEIAIGSQSGGLEIEPMIADNVIEIPGYDLETGLVYNITQESNESNWGRFTIYAYLKNGATTKTLEISLQLFDDFNQNIYTSILLPNEFEITENALIYKTITIPEPGFKTISLQFETDNDISQVESIYIDMYRFDKPKTIDNLIIKSYALDPIVSVPGQAWYNTTENVWKMTFLDNDGNLIIKTYNYKDELNTDDLIWMSVL
jgi:hypothetical protein